MSKYGFKGEDVMSKGLVEVLGTAAPEVVEVVAPVIYDAISSGPRWITRQKIKAVVNDVQLTTTQIHAIKKVTSEENLLKRFFYTELASSIALLNNLELPLEAKEALINQEITDCLNKAGNLSFSSGFQRKYNNI